MNVEKESQSDLKVKISQKCSDQAKVHNLKSFESFSKSSESLAMKVSTLEKPNSKKSRSTSRRSVKAVSHLDNLVSRDVGESYLESIMKNVQKDAYKFDSIKTEEERLRLLNIKLESKLFRLSNENSEVLKQRNYLKSELENLKQNLNDSNAFRSNTKVLFNELNDDKCNRTREISELECKIRNLEEVLIGKISEIEQVNSEMSNLSVKLNKTENEYFQVIENNNEKAAVVEDLKKKVSELYSQSELTKIYLENSDFKVANLELELNSLRVNRENLHQQLEAVESTRELLERDVQKLNNCLKEMGCEKNNLILEKKELKNRLLKFKESKLVEMTKLLMKLEESQKEIILIDEEKEGLEDKYSILSDKFQEKCKILEREKMINKDFEKKLMDTTEELMENKEMHLKDMENLEIQSESISELRKQVGRIEGEMVRKIEDLKKIEVEKKNLEEEYKDLSDNYETRNLEIYNLSGELNELRSSFERVSLERNQAVVGIEKMRVEIEQVEGHFDKTRQDLVKKEESLKLSEEMNEELREKWQKEVENVNEKEKLINELIGEKLNLLADVSKLQDSHNDVVTEMESLRGCLSSANDQIMELEKQLVNVKEEHSCLANERQMNLKEIKGLKMDLEMVNLQLNELNTVQKKYQEVLSELEIIKSKYNDVCLLNDELNLQLVTMTQEFNRRYQENRDELARVIAEKEEIVVVKQKQLESVEERSNKIKNEIENIQFHHSIELGKKEEEFHVELEKSRKDFSEMCQEKIRCETAIDKLQHHIGELNEEYNGKMRKLTGKMLGLQKQSQEYQEYELMSLQLKVELERRQGDLEGIMESWRVFKLHVDDLEAELAEKSREIEKLRTVNEQEVMESEGRLKLTVENVEKQKMLCNIERDSRMQCENKLQEIREENLVLSNELHELHEKFNIVNEERNSWRERCDICRLKTDKLEISEQSLIDQLNERDKMNRDLLEKNYKLIQELDKRDDRDNLENVSLKQLLVEVESRKMILEQQADQLTSNEVGYKKEMEALQQFIQDIRKDRDNMSRHIDLSNKQEVVATAVLFRLRNRIRHIIYQNWDDIGADHDQDFKYEISRSELSELQKLLADDPGELQSQFSSNCNNKPLGRLSSCVEDLRCEIDALQADIAMEMENTHVAMTAMT